jgi:hypothetical protein
LPASRFLKSGPSFVCTRVMWFLKRYRFVNVINATVVVDVDDIFVDVSIVGADIDAVIDDAFLLL